VQLHELISVTTYLTEVIKPKNFEGLYQTLITHLNQLTQPKPPAELATQINDARDVLFEAHKEIHPVEWNVIKIKLFKSFGADELFGKTAIARLEEIFSKNQANPQAVATALNPIMQETKKVFTRITQLHTGLGPMIEEGRDADELEDGKTILQIIFEHDAAIKTMKDLEDNSKIWRRLFLAFARLVDEGAEDPEIVSVEKGSIIIEILTATPVAIAIAVGCDQILKVLERVLEIRKKFEEIKNLKLSNKKIEQELEKEADNLIEVAVEKAKVALLKEYRKKKKTDQEIDTGLKNALGDMFSFIESGGKLEVYEPRSDSETDSTENGVPELGAAFGRIRLLENKVEEMRLLNSGKGDN